jgi:hypothetical protein
VGILTTEKENRVYNKKSAACGKSAGFAVKRLSVAVHRVWRQTLAGAFTLAKTLNSTH